MSRLKELKTFVEEIAKKNELSLDFDYNPGIGVFSVVFDDGKMTTEITIPEEDLDNRLTWDRIESEAK